MTEPNLGPPPAPTTGKQEQPSAPKSTPRSSSPPAPPAPPSQSSGGGLQKFKESINGVKQIFEKVNLPNVSFIREANYAVQIAQKNDQLLSCSPKSVQDSVSNVALTGLSLNPVLGEAYLVPRRGQAVFHPGYKGLKRLALEAGICKAVWADVVWSKEVEEGRFVYEKGSTPVLEHKPILHGDKGYIIGAYCVIQQEDGIKVFEYMSIEEIFAIAKRGDMNSGAAKMEDLKGPWKTDTAEQCKKTVMRRGLKGMPMGSREKENERLQRALDLDNGASGIQPTHSDDNAFTDFTEITE